MQLADGNRIDLSLFPISRLDELKADSLREILLVAGYFDLDYPHREDDKVSTYLEHVRRLPRDATEIY